MRARVATQAVELGRGLGQVWRRKGAWYRSRNGLEGRCVGGRAVDVLGYQGGHGGWGDVFHDDEGRQQDECRWLRVVAAVVWGGDVGGGEHEALFEEVTPDVSLGPYVGRAAGDRGQDRINGPGKGDNVLTPLLGLSALSMACITLPFSSATLCTQSALPVATRMWVLHALIPP